MCHFSLDFLYSFYENKSMFKLRIRAIVGIMMFLGYFILYLVRYNLSVHILDMTALLKRDTAFSDNSTIEKKVHRLHSDIRTGVLLSLVSLDNWRIAVVFSAYHIGYIVCFPIFHSLGDRLGPTWVVGIAGIISGTLNCITPAAVYFEFWMLFVVRVMKGFCAGAMLPSMVQLLRHWVPPTERHYFMWAYCGITAGTFSAFLICAAVQFYSKWWIGFYSIGVIQIFWALMWFILIADYPSKHPFIARDELEYLNSAIGTIFTLQYTNAQAPWSKIIKSVPFWALCILNFGYAWMIMSLCIHGPLYYFVVVEYNIYNASALTALPFMFRLILGTITIQAYHWCKHNSENFNNVKHIRKYFIVVSHVIPGVLVVFTWTISIIPGPILLTLAVALTAAGMDLTFDLCYELSPTFVNSINTVIKIIGNVPGVIVPLTVGEVTHRYKNSPFVWKHIWCFHALILLLSGITFLIWGETQIQEWNYNRTRIAQSPRSRIKPNPSKMSNIMEVDEDDSSMPMNRQTSRNSSLLKPFRILQSKGLNNG